MRTSFKMIGPKPVGVFWSSVSQNDRMNHIKMSKSEVKGQGHCGHICIQKKSVSTSRNACMTWETAIPDYQETVQTQTDGQTDARQSDPYVSLCFAGNTITLLT